MAVFRPYYLLRDAKGEVMTWYPGWHMAVVWVLAMAVAAVVYFVPMTRFIDNLSDRATLVTAAE